MLEWTGAATRAAVMRRGDVLPIGVTARAVIEVGGPRRAFQESSDAVGPRLARPCAGSTATTVVPRSSHAAASP